VQDQYFEFCDWLGAPTDRAEWNVGPWNDAEREWQREFVAQFERPYVPLVVATSTPNRDWPAERWVEVCDALWSDFGVQPVLVGGRSDRELAAEQIILSRARHKPVSALGSGLRRLAAILQAGTLVISPDTGPLHLSVALRRPVIGLYGYSNPRRAGPYRWCPDLLVDAYTDPDEQPTAKAQFRPGRMPRITVRDVLDRVERWRTRYAGR
jgi:heptosyltransferase I